MTAIVAVSLTSCSRDEQDAPEAVTRSAAESGTTPKGNAVMTVETDWAGQRNVNFDELQDDTLSIAIPEGAAPEGNIKDAI